MASGGGNATANPPESADEVIEEEGEEGGIDPRFSPDGYLLESPGGDALPARWLGKGVVGSDGLMRYQKLQLGSVVFEADDVCYLTPAEKGDPFEIVAIVAFRDNGPKERIHSCQERGACALVLEVAAHQARRTRGSP